LIDLMARAIENARAVRRTTAPNPWVGSVVVAVDGRTFDGATEPPGARHAEIVALDAAGDAARGATLVTTLEPCSHTGRTPPCVERIIGAGIARVVVGIEDPDPHVAGRGIAALRAAGIETIVGIAADDVSDQLAPYLHHRRTGRPYVVLKMAATLDGRTAAADGTSRWITGADARRDVHRLRADADAVLVGAGTVRADDPELTVRDADGPDPLRVVLGTAPPGARVHPCLELTGELHDVLDTLGGKGVLQLLVEGGATVAGAFHAAGLVDEYVLYLAPAFLGSAARPLLDDATTTTIADAWRGRIERVEQLGDDLKVVVTPVARHT
jgi:diaminohydroxyphosphoribosylaminopyrimidine deaminase / 5-amino-6-(5-phosphoribosylamino)uracil reductase